MTLVNNINKQPDRFLSPSFGAMSPRQAIHKKESGFRILDILARISVEIPEILTGVSSRKKLKSSFLEIRFNSLSLSEKIILIIGY